MKKLISFIICAAMVMTLFSSVAWAAETDENSLNGYFVPYTSQMNADYMFTTDLIAAKSGNEIAWYFDSDGLVKCYDEEGVGVGTFTAEDGVFTVKFDDGEEETYDYEFIDGLLVAHNENGAYILVSADIDEVDGVSISDYSTIEVNSSDVEVTDETVDTYVDQIVSSKTVAEQITEGTVEEGDVVTIAFEGTFEGEEEPFEGGTSEGLTIQVGSGALIDNFEEQMTGKNIGEEFDVTVTFPEDYTANEEYVGKTATFKTTVLYKTVTSTPELNDEFVQEYSEKYLPEKLETVDEFKAYYKEYLYKNLLHTAIFNVIQAKTTITAYNQDMAQLMIDYSANTLAYYAAVSGYSEEDYAAACGYDSVSAYELDEAQYYMDIALMINRVLADLGIYTTSSLVEEETYNYIKESGLADTYTVDSYVAEAGEGWNWIFNNLNIKFNLAGEALEDRVVFVESSEEDAQAEETAEQDAAEEAEEAAETEERDVAEEAEEAAETEEYDLTAGTMAGGWTIYNDDTEAVLPEGVQEVFDKALEGYAGAGFTPVAYMASQVVAGVNHMILCKCTQVTAEPVTTLAVITIYQDLEGNATITNVSDFNLADLMDQGYAAEEAAAAGETQTLAGGWTVSEDYQVVNLPAEAQTAFDKALSEYAGVDNEPLALLGTQVVAGVNYAVLCHGSSLGEDDHLAVAFIYADLDGGAQLLTISRINTADYTN